MNSTGITKGYPRIRKRFGKLAGYIQLVRPFTLLAPILAGILGILSTVDVITPEIVETAIYVGITLALAQATGQTINQYADAELDALIKPYRPIPSKLLTREEALGVAWLLALFSIARAFTLNEIFGLGTAALIFFAVFYSLSPLSPRKINPILNVTWMATSRGFIPILLVWSIYGQLMNALPYAILAFVWVLGFQATKDLNDVVGDRKHGIKTICSAYGTNGLRILMASCGFAYLILCVTFQLNTMALLSVVAGAAILGINMKSRFTENNYGWMFFYLGLGLFFILMFLTEYAW